MQTNYLLLRFVENFYAAPHINAELELVYVKRGQFILKCDGVEQTLSAGEASLILPYRVHEFHTFPDTEAYVLMFSYSVAEEFYNLYHIFDTENHSFKIDPTLDAFLFANLELALKSDDIFVLKSLFYPLIAQYLKQNKPALSPARTRTSLRQIVDYLTEHGYENVTLSKVSSDLGIGIAEIRTLFQDQVGATFGEFVNNVRLEKAFFLLHREDLTVTEIAYQCGFGSVRNFNRLFTTKTGLPPSKYKNQIYKKK